MKTKTPRTTLAIARRQHETIRLYTPDGPIDIQVTETRRRRCKLRITAHPQIRIVRKELLEDDQPIPFPTSNEDTDAPPKPAA